MPELPEVETVCRALAPHLTGLTITDVVTRVSSLRLPVDSERLTAVCVNRSISGIRRRGKYLALELAGDATVVLHLGMTGMLRICPATDAVLPHDRVLWGLSDGRSWRLADTRKFSCVLPFERCDPGQDIGPLANLGIEPLDHGFDGAYLHAECRGRMRPVKNLIMDQTVVVGVGNIYASEVLFRAGIHPRRAGGRLSRRRCEALAAEIRSVLTEAIDWGGTTIINFRAPDGSEGLFRQQLRVYGRENEPCLRCAGHARIRRIVLGGRSTYYCPRCQR